MPPRSTLARTGVRVTGVTTRRAPETRRVLPPVVRVVTPEVLGPLVVPEGAGGLVGPIPHEPFSVEESIPCPNLSFPQDVTTIIVTDRQSRGPQDLDADGTRTSDQKGSTLAQTRHGA